MRFNEEKHTYISNDITYLSATSFIKKFCKPFDRIKIGTKYAKKNKRTLEEVLAEWDKSGADSIKKGIFFHKIKETELLETEHIIIDDEPHSIFPCSYENGDKITTSLKLEPGVYPELIVWSDRYSIAGQADYVEITKSGKINIKDYKTSKEIKTESFMDWKGQHQMMSFPFNALQDCNFNHYSLQLNLYAYLIKSHNRNLEIGTLTIEHIIGDFNEEENKFEIKEIVQYRVPDLQDDIKVGLEYWKNKNI
jgi:hypothetical protein